jgi:hypothetical protein
VRVLGKGELLGELALSSSRSFGTLPTRPRRSPWSPSRCSSFPPSGSTTWSAPTPAWPLP